MFVDNVSQQTRLLEKRRQVFEVEEALSAQKEEFARREEAFRRREEGLRKKDLELQETLIRFNQIITENDTKRTRAEKRSGEETVAVQQKEMEIYDYVAQIQHMREEMRVLSAQQTRLEGDARYLQTFQAVYHDEYADVAAVLERFKTLTSAHFDLLSEQQRLMNAIEEERRNLARVQKAASTQMLTSENITSKLKARLEELRGVVTSLQTGAEESTVQKGRQHLEVGQILQSVLNLHNRCMATSYGSAIRHTPADCDVLGYRKFMAPGEDTSIAHAEAVAAMLDEERDTELQPAPGSPAAGRRIAAPPPPPPSPTKLAAELEALDKESLRVRLQDAMQLLQVVGSYCTDFEDIVSEYPAWLEETRRKAHEKELAALAEAKRIAAARAARLGAVAQDKVGGAAGTGAGASAGGPALSAGGPSAPKQIATLPHAVDGDPTTAATVRLGARGGATFVSSTHAHAKTLGDGLATSGGGAAAGSLASSGVNPGMSATAADSSAAAVAIAAAMQKGGTRAYVARGFVAPLPLGATPVSAGVGAGTSVAGLGVSYGGMGASLGTSVAVASARKALAQTIAAAHNTLRSPLRPAPGARTGGGTRTG